MNVGFIQNFKIFDPKYNNDIKPAGTRSGLVSVSVWQSNMSEF